MDTIDFKPKAIDVTSEEIYFSSIILQGRISEINSEFIYNMKKEYYHSANALTRQMIEIYHIASLLNYDNDYCKKFWDNRLPNFTDIRGLLKKENHFPKIEGITVDEFFDSLEKEYYFYSGILHPKKDSFIHNLLICDIDKKGDYSNLKPYNPDAFCTGKRILLFPERTPFPSEDPKRIIHVFYQYTLLSLNELKELQRKKLPNNL